MFCPHSLVLILDHLLHLLLYTLKVAFHAGVLVLFIFLINILWLGGITQIEIHLFMFGLLFRLFDSIHFWKVISDI